VVYPSYDESISPFKGHDTPCDPSPWAPQHEWQRFGIHKSTAVAQIRALAKQGFDAVVNLCDGAFDEDRPGIEVVHALEHYGIPYTGANAAFYEPTRDAMKRVCHAWDVPTPAHWFARTDKDLEEASTRLRFPMIVKHENSYGSIGMGRDARVEDVAALFLAGRAMIASYGGALVEEFIEGREFTVLVAENPDDPRSPVSFVPVECKFPPGESFKHFDLKWVGFEGIQWSPVRDEALAARLCDAARAMFLGCRGVGYGRCDIRMDSAGGIYMLEINANCGIFYERAAWGSADWILDCDPMGHAGFIDLILRSAIARAEARKPKFAVRPTARGYGLVAERDLPEGAMVQRNEEQPTVLVTRDHVEKHWTGPAKRWFHQYCWPVGPNTFAMWNEDPARWEPIDHSCDPNSWLVGLDLVTRRPVQAGEQITMDYSTFCGDEMETFTCSCGAAECRGTVRGTDLRNPELRAKYAGHLSPWVAANP
jgi:D-alanine-D-alanine ligase